MCVCVSMYVGFCEYVYLCVSTVCVCVNVCLISLLLRKSKQGNERLMNKMTIQQRNEWTQIMEAFKTMEVSTSPSPSPSPSSRMATSPRLDMPMSPRLDMLGLHMPMSPMPMSPRLDVDMSTLSQIGFEDLLGIDDDICPPQIPQLPPAKALTPRKPR